MKIVVFGLTVSSSWGNGHATLWRGLCDALARRGHRVIFFERDLPYYAAHRDLFELPGGKLEIYCDWKSIWKTAEREAADADAAMVTSFCPDGIAAGELIAAAPGLKIFYDLDTPVTLEQIGRGTPVDYIGARGLGEFDLVLSYTGGAALRALESRLGARRTAALYGSVDPRAHCPAPARESYRCDLSYVGTYAADRQQALDILFLQAARRAPDKRFVLAGAQYPADFPWAENIFFVQHVPPADHGALYGSSRLTLNVTRSAMARMGYCPSGRLFEAAACAAPILSDWWEGFEQFFEPGREVLVARDTDEVLDALARPERELRALAQRARARALEEHSAARRAVELENLLERAGAPLTGANFSTARIAS